MDTIRILPTDGGDPGNRPAMVLAEIERKAGKAIRELFDLIAATSTAGASPTLGVHDERRTGGALALSSWATRPDATSATPATSRWRCSDRR